MKNKITLLLLFLVPFQMVFSQVPQEERDALISLYNSTDGTNWYYRTFWNTNVNVGEWYGVKVENINGQDHVTELKLIANNLKGEIPDLSALKKLKFLYFHNNKITKFIDGSWDLPELTHLYINDNQLTNIPNNIGNMPNLKDLRLTNNLITSLPLIHKPLEKIEVLDLSNNKFETISDGISAFTKISKLTITNNPLKEVSPKIADCQELLILIIHFDGYQNFQPAINNLNKLEKIDIKGLIDFEVDIRDLHRLSIIRFNKTKLKTLKIDTDFSISFSNNHSDSSYFKEDNPNLTCIEVGDRFPDVWLARMQEENWYNTFHTGVVPVEQCTGNYYVSNDERNALKSILESNYNDDFSFILDPNFNVGTLHHPINTYKIEVEHNFHTDVTNIIKIRLSVSKGVLPPDIQYIENLRELKLTSSNNYQPLPNISTKIGELDKLKKLQLTNLQLTSLPNEIGNLASLEEFIVQNNDLTEFPNINNLSNLKHLNVYNNKLNSIPGLEGCTKLEYLNFSSNKITSLMPDIGNLEQLKYINGQANELTEVPLNLENLIYLEELHLSYNKIKGYVDLSNNLVLKKLTLRNNKIEGLKIDAPASNFYSSWDDIILKDLPYLGCLDVAEPWVDAWKSRLYVANSMPGLIITANCSEIKTLSTGARETLANFYTSTGGGTDWLGEYWELTDVAFSGNLGIWEGLKTEVIDNEVQITRILLAEHGLTGTFSLSNLPELFDLYLDGNYFNEETPYFGENLNKLTSINLSNNNFSGNLNVNNFISLPSLSNLNLSNNKYSGPIPSSIGDLSSIRNLNLSGNNFNGSLPDSLFNLDLVWLFLQGNNLSGEIPSHLISKLSSLEWLYLSNNNFSGNFPEGLNNLSELSHLYINHNDFNGYVLTTDIDDLIRLSVKSTNIEGLKIKGYPNQYSIFDVSNTPNLNCIEVETEYLHLWVGSYSKTFSDNCNYALSNNDTLFDKFLIFPNPVDNQLEIKNPNNIKIEKLEIYSLLGAKIKSFNKVTNLIDVTSLSKGIYLLKIYTNQGKATKRVFKN